MRRASNSEKMRIKDRETESLSCDNC